MLQSDSYKKDSSLEIIDKLDKDYFQNIEMHCKIASDCAIKLKVANYSANSTHASPNDIYINMCLGVIEHVKQFIQDRREEIVGYVKELANKVSTGHDCSECSTGCAIKHASKIPAIQVSHAHTKNLFGTLDRIASPVYETYSYSELYKILRDEMVIIQTSIIELFYLEESVLIPKILEEQKAIHVRR